MNKEISKEKFRKINVSNDEIDIKYSYSIKNNIIRTFKSNKLALICLILLVLITLVSIFAPVITKFDPNEQDVLNKLSPPSRTHLFGTDELGRDYFTRTIYGGRISLSVGFLSMILSTLIGTIIGLISGFYGGKIDTLLMRFTDVFLTLPSFLLIVVINTILPSNVYSMIIILGLFEWSQIARVVRAETISLKESEFIVASRHLGASKSYIILKHILPNIIPTIIVGSTLAVARAILTESSLSFLGVGIQLPKASWGTLLRGAQSYIITNPYLAIYPGVFIVITVISFNVMGDAIRSAVSRN